MLIEYQHYRKEFQSFIDEKQSFEIVGVPTEEMLSVCEVLESYIEKKHFKCRIYTQNRVVTGLAGLLNPAFGVISMASILAHNLVTYNPDYEIGRDIANNRISVKYKKKV